MGSMRTCVTDRQTDRQTDRRTDGAGYIGPAFGRAGPIMLNDDFSRITKG